MSTYKVIQDIEAEDKLIGPLTLRQFIYAGIAAVSGYLAFLFASKGAPFMLGVFLPITGVCGFFAFPWGQDQPTEVWALAKIRFILKPRRRIWDQSGTKELVSVTAPKTVERQLTNGLNQNEVHSRLSALANTIDSRGWAIKNVNVNLATQSGGLSVTDTSDRLVQASSLPQEVSSIDVNASDDIMDESANPIARQFDSMITAADTAHRQHIVAQLQQPTVPISQPGPTPHTQTLQPPADYWFLQGQTPTINTPSPAAPVDDSIVAPGTQNVPTLAPQAAAPTPEEEALIDKLKTENANTSMSAAYGHMKTLKTPEQLAEEARKAAATVAKPPVTPTKQAAIMNLANNDDLDVATIARQAHEQVSSHDDGEVIISLR
jgi:hypothetical protein